MIKPLFRTVLTCLGTSVTLLALGSCAHRETGSITLCPEFTVADGKKIKLTTTEKKLVCSFPGLPSWDNIPLNQALFNFRACLQERGYFHPVVTDSPTASRHRGL